MMNIRKIIQVLSLIIISIVSILLSYGFFEDLNIKIVPVAISVFALYFIALDMDFDNRVRGCEKSIREQINILKRIHEEAIPIELIPESKALDKWFKFEEMINAYNAPWTLADNKLYPAFKKFLRKEDVKLRILLFDGDSDQQKKEYIERKDRIKALIKKLKSDNVKFERKIQICKVVESEIPTTTFFISKTDGVCTSILYIYPFMNYDEPMFSVQLSDDKALGAMANEFSYYWKNGTRMSINDFLD